MVLHPVADKVKNRRRKCAPCPLEHFWVHMVEVDELESKRRVATMLACNGRTDPTPNFIVARGRGASLDSRVPAALLANTRPRTLLPMVNHWHRLLSKQVMASVRNSVR